MTAFLIRMSREWNRRRKEMVREIRSRMPLPLGGRLCSVGVVEDLLKQYKYPERDEVVLRRYTDILARPLHRFVTRTLPLPPLWMILNESYRPWIDYAEMDISYLYRLAKALGDTHKMLSYDLWRPWRHPRSRRRHTPDILPGKSDMLGESGREYNWFGLSDECRYAAADLRRLADGISPDFVLCYAAV